MTFFYQSYTYFISHLYLNVASIWLIFGHGQNIFSRYKLILVLYKTCEFDLLVKKKKITINLLWGGRKITKSTFARSVKILKKIKVQTTQKNFGISKYSERILTDSEIPDFFYPWCAGRTRIFSGFLRFECIPRTEPIWKYKLGNHVILI